MKHFIIYLFLLISSGCLFAQKQKLTLEESVLKQQLVYPSETIKRLQSIPGSPLFAFTSKRYDTLFTMDARGIRKTVLTLEKLNQMAGFNARYIAEPYWVNKDIFHIIEGNGVYEINLKVSTAQVLFRFPEEANNLDYHVNGKRLAYTIENKLYLADGNDARKLVAGEDQLVSGQSIARQEFGITEGIFWSDDGNLLAYYQKDESEVGDYPLLDITKTPGELVTIKYPMAGQTSEQAFVGVFNAATGSTLRLKVPGPRDQYLTNVCVTPDNKNVFVAVVNREQNHMKLQKFDATTGELVSTLLEETDEQWVEPEHPAWFIPGSKGDFLWFSEKSGYMHLYRYSQEGTEIGKITDGQIVVDEIFGTDKSGQNIIFAAYDESGLNRCIYSAPLTKPGKTIRISEATGIHNAKLSADRTLITDTWSTLEKPYHARIIDTKGKIVKEWIQAKNPLENIVSGITELVQITAADGVTKLNGRLIKPADFDPTKKYPVLVYVYGGPHAQMVTNSWLAGASYWMHWLAVEHNYLVFTLDNRGSAHRGVEFEQVIHRQLGTVEMADQMKGVEYLKSLPFVDGSRLAVHGWSFGGFMTTSLMLREPGTFTTGIAGGPVTDWKYYEVMYGERYMDKPEENPEGYATARLMNHTRNLQGKLLLVHGTVDDVVVMQHNLALVKQFIDDGIQIDFFPYPMHPHNVQGKDRLHLMEKVLRYVLENNK